jgi:hypothetical protein
MLVGCQNGNIYFLNFASGCGVDSEFMCPLYSLAQAVVGIHTVCFPKRRTPEAEDFFASSPMQNSAESGVHNAMIFVGQAGKIAICCVGSDTQSLPCFQEFHVPAPVLSSTLVSGQCLLYSTLNGLYRICLKQECAYSFEEKIPPINATTCPISIPQASFKFPELMQNLYYRTYLLHRDTINDSPTTLHFLCVSLGGHLSTISAIGVSAGEVKTSTEVCQELKRYIQNIELQSREIDCVIEKINSMNSIVTKLKGVLDILVAAGGACLPHSVNGSCSPFTCSFKANLEKVGCAVEKMQVTVEVTYTKSTSEALSDDWSLLLVSQFGKHNVFKSVSLAGLVARSSVAMAVDVPDGLVDGGWMECFLIYSPQRLCVNLSDGKFGTFKCVSLLLARREFDMLDFICQNKSTAREVASSCRVRIMRETLLKSIGPSKPAVLSNPPPLDVSHRASISLCAATNNSGASGPAGDDSVAALINAMGGIFGMNTKLLTSFDNERIGFKLNNIGDGEEGQRLEVHASSNSMLVQVLGCVNARLRSNVMGSRTCVYSTACSKLEGLEGLLEQVRQLQRELSVNHQAWKSNCMLKEAYQKLLLTWKVKACTAYCKIRGSS